MTMIALYPSKKVLKENIGQPLKYVETSFFGPEYKPNGSFTVCNRPTLPEGYKSPLGEPKAREFFATVTMTDGVISNVT